MEFVRIAVGIESTIVKSRRSPVLFRLDRICIPMRHVLRYMINVLKCKIVCNVRINDIDKVECNHKFHNSTDCVYLSWSAVEWAYSESRHCQLNRWQHASVPIHFSV